MAEYINIVCYDDDDEETFGISEARIDLMSTIDIVHCGECIHYEEDDYISHHGDVSCLCGNLGGYHKADHFCGYGERK